MRLAALRFDRRACPQRFVFVFGAVVAAMLGAVLRLNAGAPVPPVMVVDIIPESLSGETSIDSEPNLGVNPANPSEIAASAFTPEPLGGKTAPIFISADGGKTWSCRSTVPINKITDDMTLRFGGLNMLYVTALNERDALLICPSDRLAKSRMQPAAIPGGYGIDQPYVAVAMINKKDRVFVGGNDWNGPNGRTATIMRSLDGAGNSPASSYTPVPIELDAPARDSSEIRPAISADGNKVYAVFNRVSAEAPGTRVGSVILVRDDDGGNSGAASFTALRDENGLPGLPVVKARTFPFETENFQARLGRDRLGGDLAIAVDPRNANTVYLVWGELIQNQPTLHVIRSDDGGAKWSRILRTVTNTKNPGLAMNANGTLAFLYQQVVISPGGEETWMTKLERTKDDFNKLNPLTLAIFPVAEIDPNRGQPQLGDYLHLMSVGKDFYGIFSSSNVPDRSRFPCDVTFQRHADFTAKKLLDQDGNVVPSSIDPFFVRVKD